MGHWEYVYEYNPRQGKRRWSIPQKVTDKRMEETLPGLLLGEAPSKIKITAWRFNRRWKIFTFTDVKGGLHIIRQVKDG